MSENGKMGNERKGNCEMRNWEKAKLEIRLIGN